MELSRINLRLGQQIDGDVGVKGFTCDATTHGLILGYQYAF